jgi:hypothetical protein
MVDADSRAATDHLLVAKRITSTNGSEITAARMSPTEFSCVAIIIC